MIEPEPEPVELSLPVRAFVAPLEPSGSIDARLAALSEGGSPVPGGAAPRPHPEADPAGGPGPPGRGGGAHPPGAPGLRLPGAGAGGTCCWPGTRPPSRRSRPACARPPLRQAVEADPDHPFALQARMYAWILWRDNRDLPRPAGCGSPPSWTRPRRSWTCPSTRRASPPGWKPGWRSTTRPSSRPGPGPPNARPWRPPSPSRSRTPAPGRPELAARVDGALEQGRRLLLQAPTGLGKTAAILHPALRRALDLGPAGVLLHSPQQPATRWPRTASGGMREQGHPVRSVTIPGQGERSAPSRRWTAARRSAPRGQPLLRPPEDLRGPGGAGGAGLRRCRRRRRRGRPPPAVPVRTGPGRRPPGRRGDRRLQLRLLPQRHPGPVLRRPGGRGEADRAGGRGPQPAGPGRRMVLPGPGGPLAGGVAQAPAGAAGPGPAPALQPPR